MKQKSGIALVSMILFILLCNVVFAEDENTNSEYEDYFDLSPDEDFMVEMHYETGDMFYHIIIKGRISWKKYVNSESKIKGFSLLYVPKSSSNFHVYVEDMDSEIEPVIIKNKEELNEKINLIDEKLKNNKKFTELVKFVPLSQDKEYIENLSKDLDEGNRFCVIIYPEYLYEKEKFILRIEFDTKISEDSTGSDGFYKNWFLWRIVPKIKNFDHVYFVLPKNAKPWIHNANAEFTKNDRNILKWYMKEGEENYLLATFGIPEERLHWENYINNIQNFIYIVFGIFLAVTAPIILVKFKKYRFIKCVVIFCSPFLFFLLMRMHIYNQNIGDIPIETCVGGECLKGTPLFIAVTFFIVNIALFSIFHFCIDRREQTRETEKTYGVREEAPEQVHEPGYEEDQKSEGDIENRESREETGENDNGEDGQEKEPKRDNNGKGKKEEDQKQEEEKQNQEPKEKTKIIETKKESKKMPKKKGKNKI